MNPKEVESTDRAPRYLEVIVGVVASLFGMALLGLTGLALLRATVADVLELGWVESIILVVFVLAGYLFCVVGWRLLTGQGRRSDGGLLPPSMLTFGGVLFLVGGVIVALQGKFGLVHAVSSWASAVTCFVLARYRRRLARANREGVA
jgi:hypothetical protein